MPTDTTTPATTKRPAALADYPIVHTQTVSWGEMDALGHVNNVVYHRYAENARIVYLGGLDLFNRQTVVVLAQASCQYLRPVLYPDTLQIGVRCRKLGNSSAVLEYAYYSDVQQQVVATADSVLVRLNPDAQHKQAWRSDEREQILALEQQVGRTPAQ